MKPQRPYRIIFNNDGDVLGFPGMMPDQAEDRIRKQVFAPLANSQVDALFWCLGLNTVRYATRVAEFYGEDEKTFHKGTTWASREMTRALIERGMDPPRLICRLAAEYGIDCFMSLRMNDGHDYFGFAISKVKREHPERVLTPLTRKPNESFRPWNGLDMLYNYAYEEVREEKYRIIDEICRNYPVDGFELDFMRHPRYFPEGTAHENAHLITELIRRVRRMMDEVSVSRRKPLRLAVRIPSSLSRAMDLGLDLKTWMSEGLVDIVTVSTMDSASPIDLDLESFLPYRKPGCRMHACIPVFCWYGQYPTDIPTVEELRALSYDCFCKGFDGVYLWNANYLRQSDPDWNYRELHEIGDAKSMARQAKTYRVFNVWHVPRPLVDPDPQLPTKMSEDSNSPTQIHFSIGDDPADPSLRANLLLEIFNRTYIDELDIRLNDRPLNVADSDSQPMMTTSSDAGRERMIFTDVRALLLKGRNTLSIFAAKRNAAITEPITLSGLKVFVDYAK